MPLNSTSINKRHVPLNNSLNREHHHFISSDNYPFYFGFSCYLLALHQRLDGGGVGGKSESEASGDKRLGKGDTSNGTVKAALKLLTSSKKLLANKCPAS